MTVPLGTIASGNPLLSLSEQTLVSCDRDDGNDGCNGGFPFWAIDWVRRHGLDTEESYPYVSGNGVVPNCTMTSNKSHVLAPANVTGFEIVAPPASSPNVTAEEYVITFATFFLPS